MKKIVIIGAGGFGREVKWLIERVNLAKEEKGEEREWDFLGFVDDKPVETIQNPDINILGNCEWLANCQEELNVVCAVGAAEIRKQIIQRMRHNRKLCFPNLIDPSVFLSGSVKMGKGNIICAGSVLTVDISLHDFIIINLDCTVGHDTRLGSFVTVYPSANLSGCVSIGECTEIGTGCHVIQGKHIGTETIVGAGAVVVRDLPDRCTAVGNPAKVIKSWNREEER